MTAHPTRRLPRSLAWIAAVALAGAAVLFGAQPASAHDTLISTDPAAGSTVQALPAQVTLAFNAVVLDEPGGTIVQVQDAAGTSLTAGDPVVSQNTVTQPLSGTASGEVTVTWRVVSSDGHPVSDSFSFTVAGAASPSAAPATPPASSAPAPTATTEPTASAAPISASAGGGSDVLPWVIGGIVAAAAIIAVIALMVARARQGKDTVRNRTEGRDDLGGR
ncbi:copper resistance CopC family protein [Microbacterium sp. SORGH_AS_0888]|uniref:copper resistance CopC family protein n=1 Tax=Microbacterium sp. SORGH_AS_0888 TaxID=3041791 RepID=UPI00277F763D|nr:copper resistance CopC family protein [Microbacterium sp. SORGH_AS_0888]MDQ1128907.1 methionine-rich copper-binding protein CopC [Microbacterium sp. SORGH_AS_0888]